MHQQRLWLAEEIGGVFAPVDVTRTEQVCAAVEQAEANAAALSPLSEDGRIGTMTWTFDVDTVADVEQSTRDALAVDLEQARHPGTPPDFVGRFAALMHDVGKSIDREIDGTHIDIGINLARRFGEPHEVIDAIAHHHDPENGETLYSVLVAAADAISAARPGARREELESYVRRLEQLEQIAVAFPGVQQAYAIQAGREVRVIVQPEKVTDAQATLLAREIAGRVEQDMEYPGQVQVTVVRESRAVEVAR